MELAQQNVRQVLAHSTSTAILSSFGKDSMLLLWLARQVRPDIPVIWFRTGLDESFGRQIVRAWNLTVFGWQPADVYTLEENGQRTLVCEYGIGDSYFPVLTDVVAGGPCIAFKRTPTVYLPFDTLLIGYKDADTHWVKGDSELFKDDTYFGRSQVIAPLRHMTDEAVRAAIAEHRIPYQPTSDELVACTECIAPRSLTEFRSRFNLKEDKNGPNIR